MDGFPSGAVAVSKSRVAENELFTELYKKYGGRVYARCTYLLRDRHEARDAMQDVFMKVMRNMAGLSQRSETAHVDDLHRHQSLFEHQPRETRRVA